MTIHLGNHTQRPQTKLSSRPERSVVEGSAVRPSALPNFPGYTPQFCYNLISPILIRAFVCSMKSGDHFVQSTWQEIRVRSGRDDNSSWKPYLAFPNKIVIPTGAYPDFLPHGTRQGRVCALP